MKSFSRRQLANYAVERILSRQTNQMAESLAAGLIVINKQKEVDLLMSDINQILEDRGLRAKATITSTRPLSEDLKSEITDSVKKLAAVDKVKLEEVIDPSLIGGIRIETANHSLDGSLKSRLARLGAADG
jgi:F-type H+-transporting ATPase subunit delta